MSSSPIYTSPYPPLPPIPSVNAHHLLLGRPEQDGWEDFPLYVEAGSGGAGGDVRSGAEAASGAANERGTKQGRANEQDSSADNTITFHASRHRVAVAATVLAQQLEEMGVDMRAKPRPMVGILSENSVVSVVGFGGEVVTGGGM